MATGIHVRCYEFLKWLHPDILSYAPIIPISHLLYVKSTTNESFIHVKHKYCYTENGFTKFMVIDEGGHHYCVNNSFWYWKWDSVEDWHRIPTNRHIGIRHYGIRWPLFSLFPNIYSHQ